MRSTILEVSYLNYRLRIATAIMLIVPVVIIVAVFAWMLFRSGQTSGYSTSSTAIGLTASAMLMSTDGTTIGTVSFTQGPYGVLIAVDAKGIAPGGHAFIIHEVGMCEPDFAAAGDHFDPVETQNGFVHSNWTQRGSLGSHGGDLPNIYAASDGRARADFFADSVTLESGPAHSLFDSNGSAVIIHEKPDNYAEEESDTGKRLACGVIRLSS